MAGNGQGLSALEQMNQLLEEKEAIIDAKRQELESYEEQLKTYENELIALTNELKEEQKRIDRENKLLDERLEKVKEYEANAEKSMNTILEEKVKLEKLSKEKLSEELNAKKDESELKKLDLNSLRASVGITTPVVTDVKGSMASILEEPAESDDEKDDIPVAFRKLEKEISKSYTKWILIELLPDRYCLQCGDKEIRFFTQEDENEVKIIIPHKNAKSDRRLQSNLININRTAPEWNIATEDNQIICSMSYAASTKETLVLKKCNDFMKNTF